MKITNVKAMVAKVLTVGMVAGALVMAAPAKAEAQGFRVGVRFGGPAYFHGPVYAPRPVYAAPYGYRYDRFHHEDWRFHHGYYR